MKKSVLLGTGILATVLLTGCGGSSSGGGTSVTEYSLSDYEGRTVSSDTLAGTWVAVGTGSATYEVEEGSALSKWAVKEYFVIKEGASDPDKASCHAGFISTDIVGDQITVENFSGTVSGNTIISGAESENEGKIVTNLSIVKISDSVEALGTITVNVAGLGSLSQGLYCFQQKNEVGEVNGSYYGASEEYQLSASAGDDVFLQKVSGTVSSKDVSVYSSAFVGEFLTKDGASANFTVNSSTDLTESISFDASSTSGASVTGTVQVQLPAQ